MIAYLLAITFFFQEEEDESDEAILNERRLLSRYGTQN